jgi:hypothetical protein
MTIKILAKTDDFSTLEYAPGVFFVTDRKLRNYDWLVVYDEFWGEERLACPRCRTILATTEPVSIKTYGRAYTRQFGHLLTNRPPDAERHPHYHLGRGYYRWFVGRSYPECLAADIPEKTDLISTVCSSKQMRNTGHLDRFRTMQRLNAEIPGFEWYGRGIRAFGRKFEVMERCKYHVAIENHIAEHHWSEKIADAWLCECLPFYAGDPALTEIFPEDSFIPIPVDDSKEAVRIVKSAMASGEYERRKPAVLEAKRLLLSRYNFWAQILEVINSVPPAEDDGRGVVYSRKALRLRNPAAALEDGWAHLKKWF